VSEETAYPFQETIHFTLSFSDKKGEESLFPISPADTGLV